jgi:acyl carrier protein
VNPAVSTCLDTIAGLLRQRPHMTDDVRLDAGAVLDDIGVDSIDLMVIFTCFEESSGLSFDNDEINPELFATLGDLAEFFAARIEVARP